MNKSYLMFHFSKEKVSKIYYKREIKNINSNLKIFEYKIGTKEDLINYISNHFNIDKNLINFEFKDNIANNEARDILDTYTYVRYENGGDYNMDFLRNIFNENIIIKINDKFQLHIHKSRLLETFEMWTEPVNNSSQFLNNHIVYYWKDE